MAGDATLHDCTALATPPMNVLASLMGSSVPIPNDWMDLPFGGASAPYDKAYALSVPNINDVLRSAGQHNASTIVDLSGDVIWVVSDTAHSDTQQHNNTQQHSNRATQQHSNTTSQQHNTRARVRKDVDAALVLLLCLFPFPRTKFSLLATDGATPRMVKAINYRLNVFGFLGGEAIRSKDPHGSTGNAGLLDQRAAMAWVQRSIIAFGGDPSRITIDGCSAGAGSTANHFVSANSWPYFAQAAGESGMFAPWNSKPLALATNIYDELLVATGCTTLACLSNKSAYAIYKASAVAEGKATVQGTSAHTSGKLTRTCLICRLNVRRGGHAAMRGVLLRLLLPEL